MCGHISMTGPLWRPGVQTKPISVTSVCFICCFEACCTEEPSVRRWRLRRRWGGWRWVWLMFVFLQVLHCTGHVLCHLLLSTAHCVERNSTLCMWTRSCASFCVFACVVLFIFSNVKHYNNDHLCGRWVAFSVTLAWIQMTLIMT